MTASMAQQSLTGEAIPLTDFSRERPRTQLFNPDTGQWRPRAAIPPADRDNWFTCIELLDRGADDADADRSHPDFDPEDAVGAWWDVRLHYNAEYAFRIPAWEKHQAIEVAEERRFDRARPDDEWLVHTEVSEQDMIAFEETPQGWDPYGPVRLHEVLDWDRDPFGEPIATPPQVELMSHRLLGWDPPYGGGGDPHERDAAGRLCWPQRLGWEVRECMRQATERAIWRALGCDGRHRMEDDR